MAWLAITIANLLAVILGIFGFAITDTPTTVTGGGGTLPGIL